jgi:hypothetical protein
MKSEYLLKKIAYIKETGTLPEDFVIASYEGGSPTTAIPGTELDATLSLELRQAAEEVIIKLIEEEIKAVQREEASYQKAFSTNRKLSKSLDRITNKLERQILSSNINSSYIETIYEDFASQLKLVPSESDPYTYSNGISLSGTISESIPTKKTYTVFGGNISLVSGSIKNPTEEEPFEIFLNDCGSGTYLEVVLRLNTNKIIREVFLELDDGTYEVKVYDRLANLLGAQATYNSTVSLPVAGASTDTIYVRIRKQTPTSLQHFTVKAIDIRTRTYQTNGTFLWGPYDTEQASTVEINVCSTVPANTSIQTLCSIDGGTSYFTFTSGIPFLTTVGTSTLVTETLNSNLIPEIIDYENEIGIDTYYLNSKVPISETLNPGKLIVKKNVRQDALLIGNVPSGWYQNGLLEYCTNISYGQTTTIDFGTSQVYVNDVLMSGVQSFLPGTYSIRVPSEYYGSVDESLLNETMLKRRDHLYPYNCRYLIEGYSYPITFRGQQVYPDKQSIWAQTLTYQPGDLQTETEFKLKKDSTHHYILVKSLYNDGWQSERYALLYKGNETGAQNLYIKIVMSTNAANVSPIAHYMTIEAL